MCILHAHEIIIIIIIIKCKVHCKISTARITMAEYVPLCLSDFVPACVCMPKCMCVPVCVSVVCIVYSGAHVSVCVCLQFHHSYVCLHYFWVTLHQTRVVVSVQT